MRIIVDAMGGDNAPEEIVKGAVRAKRELGVDVTLVGIEDKVRACLKAEGCADGEVEVVNASEIVTMEDDPSTATRRKKDSSMAVALTMLKDGKGDAVVSAGSTGALLTGAKQTVKRIRDRIQPDIVRVDFIQLHGDLVDIQIHEHIHKQHDKDRQNEYTDQLCPD